MKPVNSFSRRPETFENSRFNRTHAPENWALMITTLSEEIDPALRFLPNDVNAEAEAREKIFEPQLSVKK